MSILDSRINSIATIAIDASVNKADTANPSLYGNVNINPIISQPNNDLTCNIPSTFNTTVTMVKDLYVYGNAHFNNRITIQSLIQTVSSLDVEGGSLLNGATTLLSDLRVGGDAYFSSSSIGSYLQISDYNSTMGSQYYTRSGVDGLLTNYYTKSAMDDRQGNISTAIQAKLSVSDYNATMSSQYYTQTTSNTIFQNKLVFNNDGSDPNVVSVINQANRNVLNLYVNSPIQMGSNGKSIGLSISPYAYYTQTTSNTLLDAKLAVSDYNATMSSQYYTQITTQSLLLTDNITDTSILNAGKLLTSTLTLIKTSLDSKFSQTYKPQISDIIDLSNQLSNLFGLGKLPNISNIVGLQSALDSTFSSINKPNIGDINGLSQSLSDKFSTANLPTISNVQGLSSALANAFSPSNLPTISNVQGLSSALANAFSPSNLPGVSSIQGLSDILGLGGGSTVNLSDYYNKGVIDAKFDVVYNNDLALADRADQKFEFVINNTADTNSSQILRIGSITYQTSLLGDGKWQLLKFI